MNYRKIAQGKSDQELFNLSLIYFKRACRLIELGFKNARAKQLGLRAALTYLEMCRVFFPEKEAVIIIHIAGLPLFDSKHIEYYV